MFFRCITADMAAILKNPFLRELPPQTYLAGGTAVALYLGHRLSIDLDFFTPHDLDSLQGKAGRPNYLSQIFFRPSSKVKRTAAFFQALAQRMQSTISRFFSAKRFRAARSSSRSRFWMPL